MKEKTKEKIGNAVIIALLAVILGMAYWTIFIYEPKKVEKIAKQMQGTVVEIVESPAGFDIYVRDSLVFEFTQQNCDSNSLETLEALYNAEKELRSQNKQD